MNPKQNAHVPLRMGLSESEAQVLVRRWDNKNWGIVKYTTTLENHFESQTLIYEENKSFHCLTFAQEKWKYSHPKTQVHMGSSFVCRKEVLVTVQMLSTDGQWHGSRHPQCCWWILCWLSWECGPGSLGMWAAPPVPVTIALGRMRYT
jgi:hypothetical protein